jgi:hypothetical protein
MRKLLLLASLAAVAVVAIVATAGAKTETRFSVVHVDSKPGHPIGHNSFIQRGKLLLPSDHHVVVGHDVIKAKLHLRRAAVRLRIVARIRGEGSLKAKGIVTGKHNPSRLPIIGGTGAFNGAAGKLKIRGQTRFRGGGLRTTRFTFIFVQ